MDAPKISRLYGRFLRDHDAASFINSVSQFYTVSTLHRLASQGNRYARRAAVLAISYLGREESIPIMGEALRDPDRSVRLIVENGIRAVWSRAGSVEQCRCLQRVKRALDTGDYLHAVQQSDEILADNCRFAEVWYHRALALDGLAHVADAVFDAQQTLEKNPYHYPAAMTLARCHLKLGDSSTAMSCYYWALQIYPNLEQARLQVRRLERAIGKRLR